VQGVFEGGGHGQGGSSFYGNFAQVAQRFLLPLSFCCCCCWQRKNDCQIIYDAAGPLGRKELGIYCLKDAELPLELMKSLSIPSNAVERARVTGLPVEWVLNRGILIRFTSLLMREARLKGFLLPHIPSDSPLRHNQGKFMGATVLSVKRGFWDRVVVLDFSAMYPSQIIAENLCYSTFCVDKAEDRHMKHRPLHFQGHRFVSEEDRSPFSFYIP